MNILIESADINEMSEIFIFFGLATLYAVACPVASLLIFIEAVIFIKIKLRVMYSYIRRPIQETK